METTQTYTQQSSGAYFIDINEFVKRLEEVGYTPEQAKEQISIMFDVMNSNLATKNDLQQLELRIDSKLSVQKNDILKWYVGMFVAQIALVLALMQYLIK
jgi:hypothetical protein